MAELTEPRLELATTEELIAEIRRRANQDQVRPSRNHVDIVNGALGKLRLWFHLAPGGLEYKPPTRK